MNVFKSILLIIILAAIAIFIANRYDVNMTPSDDQIEKQGDLHSDGKMRYQFSTEEGPSGIITYHFGVENAQIDVDGETYNLQRVVSASGSRYTNEDETVVYWEHDGEATIEIDGNVAYHIPELVRMDDTKLSEKTEEILLTNGSWMWTSTTYVDGTMVQPDDPSMFVATFTTDGKFSTTSDCNNALGSYTIDGDMLYFGPLASTLMFCMDSQEAEYFQMLDQVQTYVITEGGDLVLVLEDNSGSMTFTQA